MDRSYLARGMLVAMEPETKLELEARFPIFGQVIEDEPIGDGVVHMYTYEFDSPKDRGAQDEVRRFLQEPGAGEPSFY